MVYVTDIDTIEAKDSQSMKQIENARCHWIGLDGRFKKLVYGVVLL